MTNLEKFEDEIKLIVYSGEHFAIEKRDGEVVGCSDVRCSDCKFYGRNIDCYRQRRYWLNLEYEEPEIDWTQVEVDTPIFVKASENFDWMERYFAGYIGGKVCAFNNGRTSEDFGAITPWNYAKLAESEEQR